MSTIANLKINIITSTKGMQSGLRRASKSIANFRKKLNKTFGGFARMGFVAAAAGVAILTVAIKKMISVFSDFEFKMQEVRSILLDITDRTFARLEAQARQLGATTVFTASEAGEAMSFLARAGFDVNEVMAATPALLDLAAAANMNLAEAADITSQVVRGMGLEAAEAGRVVDVLAFASARTNTTVQQLGHAFGYVAPVASALGITLEETAAMLGVLSNAGMQADRAGTGLKNIFAELAGEIDRNGIDALKKFTEGGIGVEKAFDIFQKRGGPAILALAKMHKITERLVDEMKDVEGVAKKMADIRMDSVQGAFKLLASVVQEMNIVIGERLRGTIRNMQEALRVFVIGFTETAKTMLGKINLTSFTFENMLGTLSKMLKWLGNAWDAVSRLGSALLFTFNVAKAALADLIFMAATLVSGVLWPILGLLRLVGIVTQKQFSKATTIMKESIKNAANAVEDATYDAAENFLSVFEEVSIAATKYIDDLIIKIRSIGNTPIIMTMDPLKLQAPEEGDIHKIKKFLEGQLAAAQLLQADVLQGTPKAVMKKDIEHKINELNKVAKPYEDALKSERRSLQQVFALWEEQQAILEEIDEAKSKTRMSYEFDSSGAGQLPPGVMEKNRENLKKLNLALEKNNVQYQKTIDKTHELRAITGSLDKVAAITAGNERDRLSNLLVIFATVDRLEEMEVIGPQNKSISALADVGAALEDLRGRVEGLKKVENILGDTSVPDLILEIGKLIEKINELEKSQESLSSEVLTIDLQGPLERMRAARERFEEELESQRQSTMGAFSESFDVPSMPSFIFSVDSAAFKELKEIEKKLADIKAKALELYTVDVDLGRKKYQKSILERDVTTSDHLDKLNADLKKLEAEKTALEIEYQVDEGIYEDLKKRKKELEDMGVFDPLQTQLDTLGQLTLKDSLDRANAEIEQFLSVAGDAINKVKIRGTWFNMEEVGVAAQDLKDSIKDYKDLADTIGMTAREKEIFIAKSLGVSQATLDEAAALDVLLTQKEKDLKTTERLKAAAETLRESLKGPVGEFTDRMEDLKKMFGRGLINLPEFLVGMNKAAEVAKKGVNLNVDTSKSVVGIQSALGTFKVGGAQQKQLKTQSQQLAEQKASNTYLAAISKAVTVGSGAFTP